MNYGGSNKETTRRCLTRSMKSYLAKFDDYCEFKNGEWYFPKGEDGKNREFWEKLTINLFGDTRADLKDKHIVELACALGCDLQE